jgi:hypothetical protein
MPRKPPVAPTCFVPSCPADFVGQAGKVAEVLLRKAERLRTNPDQPLKLLISGAPGIGKTSLVNLIARTLASHPVAIEDVNGKEVGLELAREWTRSLAYGSLFGSWSVKVVNELDRCSKDAQDMLLNLATLRERGANPRVQQVTAILWQAKQDGHDPAKVAERAVERIGWGGTEKGRLTAAAMVRNLTIVERLGGTAPEDLADMRRGRTASVRKGPYAGEVISVDHIIPRAIAPELDNVIANLELMPLTLNQRKGDKVGDRQVSLAKQLHSAGLLSNEGFQRVMAAKQ